MLINYKNTREEIAFQIADDLYHFKVNGLYPTNEVEKLRRVLFASKENFKHYAKKENAIANMKQYDNLLKEMIVFAENRRDCTQLEKYGTMVGVYALISYLESPLYYHENINLMDFTNEKLLNLADTIYHTPTEYLSVVCPVLILPEVYEEVKLLAMDKQTSISHEMKTFIDLLIQYINQYQYPITKERQDIKKSQQVHSLLNVTSECGDAFFYSDTLQELTNYSSEDLLQVFNLIKALFQIQSKSLEHQKTLIKK